MTTEELFEQTLRPILNELELQRVKKHKITLSSFAAAVILGLVIGGASSVGAGIFTGIGVFIIGLIIAHHAAPTLKRDFKDQVVKKIIKTLHPSLDYFPEAGFAQEEFSATGLFSTSVDRFSSEDLVTGNFGKAKIRFSEIHAEHKQLNHSDKTSVESYTSIFHGIFMELDYHEDFPGKILILPRSESDEDQHPLPAVTLGNLDFEQQFTVRTNDPQAAQTLLTPAMTERILKLKGRLDCDISLYFTDNKVLLAIPEKKDIFELSDFSHLNRMETVAGIANDLTRMTQIVGELALEKKSGN